jgi:hypothetical protein
MLTQLAIQWPRSASNGLDFDADQSRAIKKRPGQSGALGRFCKFDLALARHFSNGLMKRILLLRS